MLKQKEKKSNNLHYLSVKSDQPKKKVDGTTRDCLIRVATQYNMWHIEMEMKVHHL